MVRCSDCIRPSLLHDVGSSSEDESLPVGDRLVDMKDSQGKTAYYWAKENGYNSITCDRDDLYSLPDCYLTQQYSPPSTDGV